MIKTEETGQRLNRKKSPAIADAVDFELQLRPYEKYVLKNGVEVYTVNAGAEDVMMVEWVFFAGNWMEEKNLVAATTNFLLKNGTSKKSAFQVNEHFEYYGSYLNRACHNETATMTLHCLTRHIGELLPVVREVLSDPLFSEEELGIYKKNMQQRLQVSLKKCDFVAGRLIDAYLFGEAHPYGKYSTHEDYEALQRQELVDFFQTYYRRGKLMIFAAGKLPANLESLLNEQFGDFPLHEIQLPSHKVQPAAEKKYRVLNDPNGLQGAIRLARSFPNRHHPDFQKVQVLNNVFGGFFGSRLMSNIREDKGYTYGIYSYLQNHLHESAWMISTEAGREVCEATVEEIYKEMKELRETPVPEEELSLVKNYMMGTILSDLDGPFHIIARWKNIILNGLDAQYFYDTLRTIKTIKSDELQGLAEKYLQPDAFYELVVI